MRAVPRRPTRLVGVGLVVGLCLVDIPTRAAAQNTQLSICLDELVGRALTGRKHVAVINHKLTDHLGLTQPSGPAWSTKQFIVKSVMKSGSGWLRIRTI